MNDKQNYLPVSTLSNLSKVFNKITYSQIYIYIYIYMLFKEKTGNILIKIFRLLLLSYIFYDI